MFFFCFLSFRCESIGVFEPGAVKQLCGNLVGGKGKYYQVLGNFKFQYLFNVSEFYVIFLI